MQNHCKWVLPKVEKVSTFAVHSDRRDRCLGNGCRQSKNLNCYVYVRKMAVLSGGWPLLFLRPLSRAASGPCRDSFVGQDQAPRAGLQSAKARHCPKVADKARKVAKFSTKGVHFLWIGGRFFIAPQRVSKQNGLHLPKRAPTYAGRLRFAADGAHRHRTAGRQAAPKRRKCVDSPLNSLQI